MTKLAFIGLYDEKNLGDGVIFDCTKYLFLSEFRDAEAIDVGLDYAQKNTRMWRIFWLLVSVSHKLHIKIIHNLLLRMLDERIRRKAKRYFSKLLDGVDLAVVVGGGIIKFKNQSFGAELLALVDVANKKGVRVVLNAVGVEGFDLRDPRCRDLVKALHGEAVISISTRDDLDTLVSDYFQGKPRLEIQKVCDPAVWASEAYQIVREPKSDIIGIGIIRLGIFRDYGLLFTEQQALSFYLDAIEYAVSRGCQVELFTNGLGADVADAVKVQTACKQNLGINLPIRTPERTKDLIEIISRFKGIIAGRMHACIVAYSLGIPAVGLVWNRKLSMFGSNVNARDYFVNPVLVTGSEAVQRLDMAIEKGYDQDVRGRFKQTIKSSIHSITKEMENARYH